MIWQAKHGLERPALDGLGYAGPTLMGMARMGEAGVARIGQV